MSNGNVPPACSGLPDGVDPATLLALGSGAETVTVDGQTVTERGIDQLILLDRYLASRKASCVASGDAWGQVGIAKAIPPAADGGC